MKYLKQILLLSAILLIKDCDSNEEYEFRFGETQSGFLLDSVYQAESNGLLYVQFEANSTAAFLHILADKNQMPLTEVSKISAGGSATLPLQKGTYWKVEKHPDYEPTFLPILDTLITWTPIF